MKNAFTLIEISIVLVIIGLIVGGVLLGNDLIQSAKIRSQIKQIEEFTAATNAFKVKYNYLPGDMPPGQSSQLGFFTFSGSEAGTDCSGTGIAYGNNDGIVNYATELYPFWSHLSSSQLIAGEYGGEAGNLLSNDASICSLGGTPIVSPSSTSQFSVFLPTSKIDQAAFINVLGKIPYATNTTWVYYTDTQKINIFRIMDNAAYKPILSAYQAYQIDSKIDDALPTKGNIRVADTIPSLDGVVTFAPPCTMSTGDPIRYAITASTANTPSCLQFDFLF